MIKVMSIFGTRPEAIKMAPLVKKLNEDPQIRSVLCVTAQHREMLDQVLDLFGLTPDYDLNIMKPNQTLSMITANVLTGLDPILEKEKPVERKVVIKTERINSYFPDTYSTDDIEKIIFQLLDNWKNTQ